MSLNVNIGLMGHVDSGKTTLAQALAPSASTAAFDKHPESQERGITLDLGFSYVKCPPPVHFKEQWRLSNETDLESLQLAFVDCPGHASFIRTIIGGAQIIDMMLLVIDVQMGIQNQTAECIVIGELLEKQLIVVINKIDEFPEEKRSVELAKFETRLRKTLAKTKFGASVPMFHVSALKQIGISELLEGILSNLRWPKRGKQDQPFIMYIDHCFPIKGQGTICTGTIISGHLKVGDNVEFPLLREQRKIKSIQRFQKSVEEAKMGDRIGICVTNFNSKQLERGVICKPSGYLQPLVAVVIDMNRIVHYKFPIKSKCKLHLTIGHSTVMAKVTMFCEEKFSTGDQVGRFDPLKEYEYIDGVLPLSQQSNHTIDYRQTQDTGTFLDETRNVQLYALLEFERRVIVPPDAILIASKLDLNAYTPSCRLAFWGNLQWSTVNGNYVQEELMNWRIYQIKEKQGIVQRLVNANELIVQNLFKKMSNREIFIGHKVTLATGESGVIDSSFGKTEKVKVRFQDELPDTTVAQLTKAKSAENKVFLRYKKYVFSKKMIKM